MPDAFCSNSGSSAVVKKGGKAPMLPPRGAFVVVVVVTDKECGTPPALRASSPKALEEEKDKPDWRRQGFPVGYMRLVRCAASADGTDAKIIIAQMSEFRVTKWSLFGDEFSNDLREANC
ncbi:MAG: hypothetical protein J0L63_13140 [Anaerolineae bacterium]|nr:hypothetical protein [Anaerolineae bacterium]